MLKIILVFLLISIGERNYAQQDYFMLIHADHEQPFYVRIGEKTFSSSSQGHLILPQLRDSTYLIAIGFPKDLFPEQLFSITIPNKDLEFQLKDQGDKGWGFYNVQTREIQMPVKKDTVVVSARLEGVKKDDAFSRLMAGVVDDTAVMYNTYSKDIHTRDSALSVRDSSRNGRVDSASTKPDSLVARKDSLIAKPDSVKTKLPATTSLPSPGKTDSIKATPTVRIARPAAVEKLSEQRSATVLRQTYTIRGKGHRTDTIRIMIPLDTVVIGSGTIGSGATGSEGHAAIPAPADSLKKSSGPQTVVAVPKKNRDKPVVVNSDCRSLASDEDIDKLRLKLLTVDGDDAKIAGAKKAFRLKCLSTSQLRSLAGIFGNEASKYRLVETAYPFISDDHFRELSDLFTDPVYIGRFKSLVGG
jgi:hypothetical protein